MLRRGVCKYLYFEGLTALVLRRLCYSLSDPRGTRCCGFHGYVSTWSSRVAQRAPSGVFLLCTCAAFGCDPAERPVRGPEFRPSPSSHSGCASRWPVLPQRDSDTPLTESPRPNGEERTVVLAAYPQAEPPATCYLLASCCLSAVPQPVAKKASTTTAGAAHGTPCYSTAAGAQHSGPPAGCQPRAPVGSWARVWKGAGKSPRLISRACQRRGLGAQCLATGFARVAFTYGHLGLQVSRQGTGCGCKQ